MDKKSHWEEMASRKGLQSVMSTRWTDEQCAEGADICISQIRSMAKSISVPTQRVLEIGCGIGRLSEALGCDDYTGIDISEGMIERAKNNHVGDASKNFMVMDFSSKKENLDKRFDLIYTCTVLEHITDECGWMTAIDKIKKMTDNILFIEEIEDTKRIVSNEFDMIRSLSSYLEVMCDEFTLKKFVRFNCLEDSYGAMLFIKREKRRFGV